MARRCSASVAAGSDRAVCGASRLVCQRQFKVEENSCLLSLSVAAVGKRLVELIFGVILAGLVAVLCVTLVRHCFGKPSTGHRVCECTSGLEDDDKMVLFDPS